MPARSLIVEAASMASASIILVRPVSRSIAPWILRRWRPGCLFDRQVLVLSRPASRRARPMRGMHGIHEQHRLIGAQGIHQFLVKLDERALLGLVEMARNDFGLRYSRPRRCRS